ncbi:14875_t:CDS:10 [Entrophospora sp. SA101]|nr:14875_t:CDS:10 [Entrophospora sp. SA101]
MRESTPTTGFQLEKAEEEFLVKRVAHEKSNRSSDHTEEVIETSKTESSIKPVVNVMLETSEKMREMKKKDFIDGQEREEEMSFYSSTAGTVEAYKGLTTQDRRNVVLLIILYLLQGIPVGLAFGSIPFLLKSKLTYSQLGIFSLATYPYSLKLLWSPLVDSIYSKRVGRRKSWIIPIQLMTGSLFMWLGDNIDHLFSKDKPDVYVLTALFFILIFFSATQDVAVDGWALTLLSKNSLSYASTSQTIGLNTGYFLSFTVFLAFNSADFSNKYFRSEPSEEGILALGSYLTFWSFVYFAVTLWLIFAKSEDATYSDDEMDIKTVYQTIWNICKMPLLLTAKIGFIANEAVTALKLMEKGFSKEDLALAVLIDFPIQILVGYYAAKWSNGPQPLKPWINAFYGRIFFASVGMLVVYVFPENNKVSSSMFYVVIASIVLSSFTSTVQFVCISAFMSSIADPVIGGTYMTLLATFSNFGGTWPRFFVLEAVDYFTDASCIIRTSTEEEEKSLCKEKGGVCTVHQDGYYIVSIICVLLGILSLTTFIIPTIKNLQSRKPITIPSEVEIKHDLTPNLQPITLTDLNSTTLTISGPLGSHSMPIKPFIKIEIIANEEKRKREILSARKKEVLESVKNQDVIFIDSDVSEKKLRVDIQSKSVEHQRAMWGTTRALIANYVIGVSEGFRIPIRLVGVGHRANMESDKLVLRVGYTHPIQLEVPDGIKCEVLNPTQILLIGSDYAQLTLFAANIRKNKKPEPYNQKGIFVGDETIKKKTSKKK